MIPELRRQFNERFTDDRYRTLLNLMEQRCRMRVDYRIAETPVFLSPALLNQMAVAGSDLARTLIQNPECLAAARKAIPAGYDVAGQTPHPNFLTADFALVREAGGQLAPRLVEIQAFPSVYGYQLALSDCYREAFALPQGLNSLLGGLDETGYWRLLAQTVIGGHAPENVVLTEIDPTHQKTFPDFQVTSDRLGIPIVDIRSLKPVGNKLYYRDTGGRQVPIHRIYNRAIVDELIARDVQLPFDLGHPWEVEWAGHPNWYFLISKFSIPWLCQPPGSHPVVPPAAFLDKFLDGSGRQALLKAGVDIPASTGPNTVYSQLLLKPLFSFAGKGIQFDPTQELLESIPVERRSDYLLQQRMRFEHTIDTPRGMTQAEIRILFLWPDNGVLTPALSLVRLGRGKMMGVDHNRNQEWVGASAAFFPES